MSETQTQPTETGGEATAPSGPDWVPEAYRADPSIIKYKSLDDLIAGHKSAQSMIGMDKGRVLALPAKDDDPGWNDVYAKLGRPEKPEGYGIKAEGPDAPLWEKAQAAFHEAGLTPKQAAKLHALVGEMQGGMQEAWSKDPAAAAGQFLGRVAEFVSQPAYADMTAAQLKQEWGQAFDERMHDANKVVAALGKGDPDIEKLFTPAEAGGYGIANLPGMIKLLAAVGGRMNEPGGLTGGAGQNQGRKMTPSEAANRISEMKLDKDFAQRLAAGDRAAAQEWNAANLALVPE